jgi:exodeoxyribonuclease V beta subunit
VFFHDPDADDARTIDVALEGSEYHRHKRQALVEQRGEDLRLAYVALTRARHQAVIWWAGSWDSRHSPLGRLLFSRDDEGNVAAEGTATPGDAAAVERFEALAAQVPGCIAVESSTLGLPTSWTPPSLEPVELGTALFDRGLDGRWRRTSYSDIAAGTYEHRVATEPETPTVVDEPEAPLPPRDAGGPAEPAMAMPSLLADMPVGLKVGTFVHQVFEAVDFAAVDLRAEITDQVEVGRSRRHVDIGDPAAVIGGLAAAIETPLGPLAGGLRLRDVRRVDRLDELEFELPLAGGDDPTAEVTLTAIAELLRNSLSSGDPLADYAAGLEDPTLRRTVRGYLTGSIDSVLRLPDARFAIVDYKTNWLTAPDEPLTAWHHRPAALAAEIARGHYGLQALLYTAALHRYLRWRVPNYDPERNLAGVFYLFVRGMLGPDTPTIEGTPTGVFAWKPPAELVAGLSNILDGRAAA